MDYSVCRIMDLKENEARCFDVAGHQVLLVRDSRGIFATSATCPHQHRPLDTAIVENHTIRCRYHGVTFSLDDGKLVYNAGFVGIPDIASYPVAIQGDQILVSLK